MSDQEMIERVKEAIFNVPLSSNLHYDRATAAIKAMREPTAKMCNPKTINPELTWTNDMVWEAMIDSILND